jgi:hypothetical protein
MEMTLKPLTVVVDYDQANDRAAITVRNDQGMIIVGPLVHFHLSERSATEVINNHLKQLKEVLKLNILTLDSNMPGIELT